MHISINTMEKLAKESFRFNFFETRYSRCMPHNTINNFPIYNNYALIVLLSDSKMIGERRFKES